MKINIKLAISFLLLFILVPAALIAPLHDRVEEIEKAEQNELIRSVKRKNTTTKKVCEQATKKNQLMHTQSCKAS